MGPRPGARMKQQGVSRHAGPPGERRAGPGGARQPGPRVDPRARGRADVTERTEAERGDAEPGQGTTPPAVRLRDGLRDSLLVFLGVRVGFSVLGLVAVGLPYGYLVGLVLGTILSLLASGSRLVSPDAP